MPLTPAMGSALEAPTTVPPQAPSSRSGWKRGLVQGGLIGVGFGIVAYLLVDNLPCDTCSGTGSSSSADGAFLEFAVGFGTLGAALGALVGAVRGP